jgi:two-component system, cell cycle response regulator
MPTPIDERTRACFATGVERRHKIILTVDHDEHLLTALGDFLTSEGFDVIRAKDCEEAEAYLETGAADLIILDIAMPGMGGIRFLTRIMSGNGRLRYPVLVLTCRTDLVEFFRTVAVDGFLAKPCEEADLLKMIRRILVAREEGRTAARRTGRMILLGEHDPFIGDMLTVVLRRGRYEVEAVRTGPEVLEKAVGLLPDLIAMRHRLPGMRGDEVAALLRDMPHTSRIPVILYDAGDLAGKMGSSNPSRGIARCLMKADGDEILGIAEAILRPA